MVAGIVYDASVGPNAVMAGAKVEYHSGFCCGPGGSLDDGSVLTDAAGRYRFEISVGATSFSVRADAPGFIGFLSGFSASDLPLTLDIGLAPVVVTDKTISGVVYDASVGPQAALAGAVVSYEYYSTYTGGGTGSTQTDAEGAYAFTVPFAKYSSATVRVEVPGFAAASDYVSENDDGRVDFALIPSGGIVDVQPPSASLQCYGEVTVTVSNLAPPGETLVITDLSFHHAYSQGWYGTDFTWDTSQIVFPVFLDGGQHLTVPVAFKGGDPADAATTASGSGGFPSRLHLAVISGAREGNSGGVYYGQIEGCYASPTPTVTPRRPCAGDCDGDRSVTVNELVRAVAMALGRPVAASFCPDLDRNVDSIVSVDEIIVAVNNALRGCD